ncbi:MAG: hypothetical protein JNK87_42710 [Bryobacterales bacterium]|nr:hypothetical protein [Bryobacterales bacterium]
MYICLRAQDAPYFHIPDNQRDPANLAFTFVTKGGEVSGNLVSVGGRTTAQGAGLLATIPNFYWPFPEGAKFMVTISGITYEGFATRVVPGKVVDGSPAPVGSNEEMTLLADNVVTLTVLRSPTGQLHFESLSHAGRAKIQGSLGFENGDWILKAAGYQPHFATLSGLDAALNSVGEVKITFTATRAKFNLRIYRRTQAAPAVPPMAMRRYAAGRV